MQLYVARPAMANMKLFLLWNEAQSGSKTIYPDAMEARVRYKPYIPSQFEDITTQYKSWYQYVTTDVQKEVVELKFPQTQAGCLKFCLIRL